MSRKEEGHTLDLAAALLVGHVAPHLVAAPGQDPGAVLPFAIAQDPGATRAKHLL